MFAPPLDVVTLMLPVIGVHVTVNGAVAVPPPGTLTVWGFAPLTVQFAARPESWTVWFPAASPVNGTLPLSAMGWFWIPSTVTVYPSGSKSEPVVVVVAVKSPDGGGAAFKESVVTIHVFCCGP